MTDPDAAGQLATVLDSAGPILLDFDGPVTALMPPPANAEPAEAARRPLRRTGHPIEIVSNNATEAVETYLVRHGIEDLVSGVVGRQHGSPELMKPDPDPVERALRIIDGAPATCVLIGDSVGDIEVGRRAGLRSIGYAKTPVRGDELAAAGADTVVDDMAAIGLASTSERPR